MTIWKWTLDVQREPQGVMMPADSQVFTAHDQYGEITIWARCSKDAPKVRRTFVVVGTGWEVADLASMTYIGSAFIGQFVWHVFEKHTGSAKLPIQSRRLRQGMDEV